MTCLKFTTCSSKLPKVRRFPGSTPFMRSSNCLQRLTGYLPILPVSPGAAIQWELRNKFPAPRIVAPRAERLECGSLLPLFAHAPLDSAGKPDALHTLRETPTLASNIIARTASGFIVSRYCREIRAERFGSAQTKAPKVFWPRDPISVRQCEPCLECCESQASGDG